MNKPLVFAAMSGGVDSSVTALILKQQGYEVAGVFMRCFNVDGCAERDAEDARRVAEHIDIPFYVWDFEEAYKKRVVEYMVEGYKQGITPNPDVMCNREIKFGLFLEKALQLGAKYVATGHYVKIKDSAPYKLSAANDKNKDQSYFLWTLTQEQLRHCLFPVGSYLKAEVREIARRAGLPTAEKKDSQGICFLGQVTLADFLKNYLPEKPGEVIDIGGTKLGEHQGAHFYTIGQRQGIGNLKHQKGVTMHQPLYVSEKNIATNTVTVAPGVENDALFKKEIELGEVNWISGMSVSENIKVFARVRYRQPLAPATLEVKGKSEARLIFENPQKFVAPGQSAVFYTETGEMLGGGIIS